MGSYINIGLVSDTINFVYNSINLFNNQVEIRLKHIVCPTDYNYNGWECINGENSTIVEALNYCLENNMAYFECAFYLNNLFIEEAIFSVERSINGSIGLIISISEQLLSQNLDSNEKQIIAFLIEQKGFKYAFCDSEAHIDDQKFSIIVRYGEKTDVIFNKWRIDGLTIRC